MGIISMLISPSSAGAFLEIPKVTTADLESTLLSEFAEAVSSNATRSDRIAALQAMLKPMYDAVPHEADDTINHAVARYVLHRFFAKHRSWFVRGLEPHASIANGTYDLQDVQEWVPDYLQDFLEKMTGRAGFSLRELAIFAATLEDFVHKEELLWLKQVYTMLWHPLDRQLTKSQVKEVIETYLMVYNLDGKVNVPSPTKARQMLAVFVTKVKGWQDTVAWFTQLIDSMWGQDADRKVDFEETSSIVQAVGEKYGQFNDGECLKMKTELLTSESRKPGRIRLVDFYKKSIFGAWDFSEKIDYLRVLGALDESDPATPLVIVPNYVASRPQCLTSSNYYSVCCRDECEDLVGVLERNIAAPQADTVQIVKIVESMASSTIAAPRILPNHILARLEDVAASNGGRVPLHGRLFAQWMHHAFPRECPFPHVRGTTQPQTADEWMKVTGQQDSKATEEEMLSQVRNDSCKFTPVGVKCERQEGLPHQEPEKNEGSADLPWSQVEELLVVRPTMASTKITRIYMGDMAVYVLLSVAASLFLWVSRHILANWCNIHTSKKSDCRMV